MRRSPSRWLRSAATSLIERHPVKDIPEKIKVIFKGPDYKNYPLMYESSLRAYLQVYLYGPGASVISERHNAYGRSDLDFDAGKRHFVIELKYAREEGDPKKLLDEAVSRIQKRQYLEPEPGKRELARIAMVFSGAQKRFVQSRIVESLESQRVNSLRGKPENKMTDTNFSEDPRGALLCLCLAARSEPDFIMWCSLEDDRHCLIGLYRKALNALKSALEGSFSAKGMSSRLGDLDEIIGKTYGDETLGAYAALCALETLREGFTAFSGQSDNSGAAARDLTLSIIRRALGVAGFDERKIAGALESEGAFCDEILDKCEGLSEKGPNNRAIVRQALLLALSDGRSALGIENQDPLVKAA